MTPEWPYRSLLGRLRETTRQELLELGAPIRFAAGREVLRQGAHDSHALLLLRGVVKVQVVDEAGETALLGLKAAGDLVGEMAALDGKPRSATVISCGEVEARFINRHELSAFLSRHTDVLVELVNIGQARLRWANERRREMPSPAATRVARVLAELVREHGRQERNGWVLGFPLTKVELASIAGMKPRTAEKSFRDLRKAGLVVTGVRRDVLVPDLERLREFDAAAFELALGRT